MTDTELDRLDLSLCDLIAYLKGWGITRACLIELLSERVSELYDEVEPAPVVH